MCLNILLGGLKRVSADIKQGQCLELHTTAAYVLFRPGPALRSPRLLGGGDRNMPQEPPGWKAGSWLAGRMEGGEEGREGGREEGRKGGSDIGTEGLGDD